MSLVPGKQRGIKLCKISEDTTPPPHLPPYPGRRGQMVDMEGMSFLLDRPFSCCLQVTPTN